jgi:predicted LPLAT superfamily acyltransferase
VSAPPDDATAWTKRPEGGGRFAIWLIRTIALKLGRWPARALLWPITLYFLARVLPHSPRFVDVLRHVHAFASVILDRVFMLTEQFRRFDIRTHGLAELHESIDPGRGAILLGAHVGSFEALRVLSLERPDIRVRAVLDTGQNPAITAMLDALNPAIAATVIDASQDGTAIVLAIKEECERNAVVTLLGDRARPGEPAVPVRFLGDEAWFPASPWLIAAALRVPVVLCFGLYRGGNRYDLYFERFSEHVEIPRRERQAALARHVQAYADRLAHHVRSAPCNWFNFYDFWRPHAPTTASLPARAVAGDGAGGAARA